MHTCHVRCSRRLLAVVSQGRPDRRQQRLGEGRTDMLLDLVCEHAGNLLPELAGNLLPELAGNLLPELAGNLLPELAGNLADELARDLLCDLLPGRGMHKVMQRRDVMVRDAGARRAGSKPQSRPPWPPPPSPPLPLLLCTIALEPSHSHHHHHPHSPHQQHRARRFSGRSHLLEKATRAPELEGELIMVRRRPGESVLHARRSTPLLRREARPRPRRQPQKGRVAACDALHRARVPREGDL
eukprot:scaffold38317_cov58-Phaeocystis_antarctica.AAC.4